MSGFAVHGPVRTARLTSFFRWFLEARPRGCYQSLVANSPIAMSQKGLGFVLKGV